MDITSTLLTLVIHRTVHLRKNITADCSWALVTDTLFNPVEGSYEMMMSTSEY